MATKTICDGCGREIAAIKRKVTKFVLVIEREVEEKDENGRVTTEEELRKELCFSCRNDAGTAIAKSLRR